MTNGTSRPPSFLTSRRYKLQTLPNPTHSLRAGGKTGENKDLQDDWFSLAQVDAFYQKLIMDVQQLLDNAVVAHHKSEDSSSSEELEEILIHLGCAKGKHRSVAMAERLIRHKWKVPDEILLDVNLVHRDLQSNEVKQNKRTKMDKRQKDRDKKFQDNWSQ